MPYLVENIYTFRRHIAQNPLCFKSVWVLNLPPCWDRFCQLLYLTSKKEVYFLLFSSF